MMTESTDENLIEDIVRFAFSEAEPDPDYKCNLQRYLVNKYSTPARDMNRSNWKAVLAFTLASLVVIGLIVYGMWLPANIRFLELF